MGRRVVSLARPVNHYSDVSSDSPAWTSDTSSAGVVTTRRYVPGFVGLLAEVATTGGVTSTVVELTGLHGDVLRTTTPTATLAPDGVGVWTDEYGRVLDATGSLTTGPRYGWLGGKQRATDTGVTGVTLMGVRLYDPIIGRFLSTDPVYGGNANTYTYPVDPVNMFDLDGNLGSLACGHGRCKSDRADAERALDTISLGMGVAAMAGCAPCGGVALGINAYQTVDAARHGNWAEATASAVGFAPGIGRFGSRLMAVRYATKISRSYTKAGHALKLRRTALRRAMNTWHHRQRTWGRVLDYASLSYESVRYGQKWGW